MTSVALGASVKAVRDVLPAKSRERSTSTGLSYFGVSAVVYWISFALIAVPTEWWLRVILALLNGLAIGILFIVGHDACHGSLTANSQLNAWLGRLSFLPSLHPYAAWEYSHNALHHGWTNLKGRDPVYCPRTTEEFRRLSPTRQRLERFFRSWIGLLPLYLFEIWWRLEIRPNEAHRQHIDKRGTFVFDRRLVLAFPALQCAVVLLALRASGPVSTTTGAAMCGLAVIVPFLTFNWLIGFATFQHHTHPRVIWYDDEQNWNFFRAQVQGSVHIIFPHWIERALHNIMEHTAHHVDTRVPLYHLTDAQSSIEAVFGEENVISEPFSFAGMRRTFQCCQLYDYETHQWLTFEGRPTTDVRRLQTESEASGIGRAERTPAAS
jgi:omega-6 fatty acid desaturase (delta-12 desaturase)